MTIIEFKKKISESNNLEFYNNINESIKFDYLELDFTFKTISELYSFISKQNDGWEKIQNLPQVFNNSKANFLDIKNHIEGFINSGFEDNIQALWNSRVKPYFQTLSSCFTFDSLESKFLLELNEKNTEYFNGAYQYFTNNLNQINQKKFFIGAMLAYELKNDSQIAKRGDREYKLLNEIKSQFTSGLKDSEELLLKHLSESNSLFKEVTEEVTNFKDDKKKEVDDWFVETSKSFKDFSQNSEKSIKELENTYEQLLRLKKPAEYWKKRTEILKKEGWATVNWLIALIVFTCFTLYLLLWKTPDDMLINVFSGSTKAIKWSIVYITYISFLAIGIRSLTKLMFSSFHLARDSEEREQLTYFYLSLVKENTISDTDKTLIMQSLFSRADTGLLKEDSSPTMPGIVDKIISK